jgi:serine/threonine protein kinase/tetratricopeptide (TPR) repeat protein
MDDPLNQQDDLPQASNPMPEHVERAAEHPATPFYPGLPTGTGLGKYRILERLWTTHNAIVYKARDATLDRLVTVKQMSPSLIDNPIACGFFKREAQFLARIPKDARYVVNIHELIEDHLGLFIVEEYVAGQWLESLIAKRQTDNHAAIRILKTAAQGLRTLHSQDLMHRGVRPANIVVSRNYKAKIANLSTAAHESDTTPPPTLVPKYSAPELLLETAYDNRVDIYSLGFSLYEFCVGRSVLHSFFGNDVEDPASAIRFWSRWHTDFDAHLPDACELNLSTPPGLAAVLRRMTAKKLDDRYVSVQEVLDAISRQFELLEEQSHFPRLLTGLAPTGPTSQPPALPSRPFAPRSTPLFQPTGAPLPSLPPTVARGTSRLTVRPPARLVPETLAPRLVRQTAAERTTPPPSLPTVARPRHKAPLRPPLQPVQAETIPAPKQVEEIPRQRHPRLVAWLVSFIIFITATTTGGVALWYHYLRAPVRHPLEQLVEDAMSAYNRADYETARAKLVEAVEMPAEGANSTQQRSRADSWLRMTQAQIALSRNDFDAALRLAREAEKLGVSPSEVNTLRQLCWDRKDAYRLEEEGKKALDAGRLDEAELTVDEYKQKAEDAGLDSSALETRVHQSRANQKYQDAIKLAEDALDEGDFDRAFMAVAEAERVKVTAESRKTRQQITDAKGRADWIMRGDEAMTDKNYAEAAEAYEKANQIQATVEVERKARTAAARLLCEKAQKAIEEGDLVTAEQHLQSSMWKYPTSEARTKLERLSAVFEAARTVKQADREIDGGNYAEAIRLYEEAATKLPAPADAAAREKLLRARQRFAVQRGDQASQRGDWTAALEAYEEAKSLGGNGDVLKKIEAAKARLRP